MANEVRRSPVTLPGEVEQERSSSGWSIVTVYAGESTGPWIVDMSHVNKWDIQARNLDQLSQDDLELPAAAGECRLQGARLVLRLNPVQAAVWDLSAEAGQPPEMPEMTDVSEASALLALVGTESLHILEKLSDLDLSRPGLPAAALWQGPVCRIPCRIVRLQGSDDVPAILLAFSRGYAADMTSALLEAGREFGLEPGGERRFIDFIKAWTERGQSH